MPMFPLPNLSLTPHHPYPEFKTTPPHSQTFCYFAFFKKQKESRGSFQREQIRYYPGEVKQKYTDTEYDKLVTRRA